MLIIFILSIYFLYGLHYRFFYSYLRISSYKKKKILEKDYTKDRYSLRKIPKKIDIIVIGSGMGGLTAAGLLSKFGKKVLVLEQHYIAGGTTHSFIDKGIEHETGLHYVGNIKKRKKILDLITYNPIHWCKMGWERGKYIYDEIIIGQKHYKFEAGEDNLINYLLEKFPNTSKKSLHKYFDLVKKVGNMNTYFLSKIIPIKFLVKMISYFNWEYNYYCNTSAYQIVNEIFDNQELISVLFGQFGDYGQIPQEVNFFTHASIVSHYLDGGWFPRGGTSNIANEMCKNIYNYGGKVLVNKKVNEILILYNRVIGVIMENEDIIYCDKVISGVGVNNTFKKLVKYPIYDKLLKNVSHSVQHLYCFIKLKGSPKYLNLKSSNYWIYPHGDYKKCINDYYKNPLTTEMPLFMGFSCRKDDKWEEKYENFSNAVILVPAKKEWFDNWDNKKCMKRGEDYNNLKTKLGERMIQQSLLRFYPELKDKILDINMATPLTTQHYLNSSNGESYGLDMNSYRLTKAFDLKPRTDINGLFLTGQDICTLGVTGAMMSGVLTANVVAGYGNIIDIILGNNIVDDLHKIN